MPRYDLLYREARERISRLAAPLSPAQAKSPVPACPLWDTADLIAHLAGVAADCASGRTDGMPGTLWTHRHVRERRGRGIAANLAEWERLSPTVEVLLRGASAQVPLAHDVVQHEADLRAALGAGRPPSYAWHSLLEHLCASASARIEAPGTAVLRAHGRTWWIGSDPRILARASVDGHELWRAYFGRRSRAQMSSWAWLGDPTDFLTQLPLFPPRETDLIE